MPAKGRPCHGCKRTQPPGAPGRCDKCKAWCAAWYAARKAVSRCVQTGCRKKAKPGRSRCAACQAVGRDRVRVAKKRARKRAKATA